MNDPLWPALDIPVQDSCKHPLFCSGMLLVQLADQLLGVLALGVAVDGTAAFHHREIILIFKTDHIGLVHKHDGTNDSQIHPVQICAERQSRSALRR